MQIRLLFPAIAVGLTLMSGCSMVSENLKDKDSTSDDYTRGPSYGQGAVQLEAPIWSSDPEKRTLAKPLGADGKEK